MFGTQNHKFLSMCLPSSLSNCTYAMDITKTSIYLSVFVDVEVVLSTNFVTTQHVTPKASMSFIYSVMCTESRRDCKLGEVATHGRRGTLRLGLQVSAVRLGILGSRSRIWKSPWLRRTTVQLIGTDNVGRDYWIQPSL